MDCTSISYETIFDLTCFPVLLSKALSILIIVGSLIVKLPQIIKILGKKSVEGLDFSMFLLESIGYGIQVAYCFRNQFAFTTYGESIAMLIQNMIIVFLMYKYTTGVGSVGSLATFGLFALVEFLCFSSVPMSLLATLQGGNVLLFTVSKVPQIIANQRKRNTGNLDAFMFLLQFGGGLARIFTTMQEVGDMIFLAGFVVGTSLNGTILLQILIFGGTPPVSSSKSKTKKVQ